MHYRSRQLEARLHDFFRFFKVVLVTGARQVGKSTLLLHAFPDLKLLVFDPLQDLYSARTDPDLFLESFPGPLILDEVQFVPELLPDLKRKVDRDERPGQYLLTGSQNIPVLRNIAESLAGRVGILQLEGMTLPELNGRGTTTPWLEVFLTDPVDFSRRAISSSTYPGRLVETMWRGSLPGLLDAPNSVVPGYFSSYLQTYVQQDVRSMENVRDLADFSRFLQLLGALTAQEVNAAQLGRDIGVSPKTAQRWTDLLVQGFQWLEVAPYHGNTIKRLSGKPKGFLRDTGMACHLQRLSSPESLAASPLLGPFFESWVTMEIYRQAQSLSVAPQLYHWRTHAGAEVDLLLERDGVLHPVEIKARTTLKQRDLTGLRSFRQTYSQQSIGMGLVVFAGHQAHMLDDQTLALPWNIHWSEPDRR